MMGSPEDEAERSSNEGPQHRVKIPRRFAVSKLKITREEFEELVEAGRDPRAKTDASPLKTAKYKSGRGGDSANPGFEQDGTHPAVCIDWDDADRYVAWLCKKTGKLYRLLGETRELRM